VPEKYSSGMKVLGLRCAREPRELSLWRDREQVLGGDVQVPVRPDRQAGRLAEWSGERRPEAGQESAGTPVPAIVPFGRIARTRLLP
jgi:hypothetical protein